MRDSVYRIFLDVHNEAPQVQVTAKKGDSARSIHMRLTEYGKPWVQPPDGSVRAVLQVRTPGGVDLTNDCEIYADGTVVYNFTAMTVKEVGVDICELIVYGAGDVVLTSPRFTILVDETVFEHGQTIGAAWKTALDEAKAQIRETTDALDETTQYLKTRTHGMTLNYATVADMMEDGANLSDGMVCATKGRWAENDMGARDYRITTDNTMTTVIPSRRTVVNPLAITVREADAENGLPALYAAPIITDYVTVLDIGLRRGLADGQDGGRLLYNEADVSIEEKLDLSLFDNDDSIPAVNSRLLQNYVRYLECFGFEAEVDETALYNRISRVHFPPGIWAFRDPVVVGASVRFTGESVSVNIKQGAARTNAYGVSRILFVGGELTLTESLPDPSDFSGGETSEAYQKELASYRDTVWKARIKLPAVPSYTNYVTGAYPTADEAKYNPSYITALKTAKTTIDRIAGYYNKTLPAFLETQPDPTDETYMNDEDGYHEAVAAYGAALLAWLQSAVSNSGMTALTEIPLYIKRQTVKSKTGDEGFDRNSEAEAAQHESVYLQNALFYIRGTGCTFEHLEISTPKFCEFAVKAGSFFARDDTDIPFSLRNKYNPYMTLRRQKGICGIRCQGPALVDETNAARPKCNVNVTVDAYGRLSPTVEYLSGADSGLAAEYGGTNSANASTQSGMRLLVKECSFYCFPYAAVITGRLSEVDHCRFSDNHFAISEIGADHWIRDTYIQHGFCGIVTNSHTTHLSNSFIDMEQGFGVVSGISIVKKTVERNANNDVIRAEMEDIRLYGTLIGDYNANFDTSAMGAVGAFRSSTALSITGKIGDCGALYQRIYTKIFDYSIFRKHTTYLKVRDAVDNEEVRDGTKAWNDTNNTWTAQAAGNDETLSVFLTKYESLIRAYNGIEDAEITLYPHYKSYYEAETESNGTDTDEPDIPDREDAPATDENGEPQQTTLPADMSIATDTTDALLIENRKQNFYKMIGTAGINIAGIYGGIICVDFQPRSHWAYLNGAVSGHQMTTPIYGLNAINVRSLTFIGCTTNKKELDLNCFMLGTKYVQGLDNTVVIQTRTSPNMKSASVEMYTDTVGAESVSRALTLKFDENNGATRQVAVSGYVNVTANTKQIFDDVGMPLYPAPAKILTVYAAANYTDTQNNTTVKIGYPVATLYLVQKLDRMSVNGLTNYKGPIIASIG